MVVMVETVEILFSKVSINKNTLIDFRFKQHFKAQKGKDGAGKKRKVPMEKIYILKYL